MVCSYVFGVANIMGNIIGVKVGFTLQAVKMDGNPKKGTRMPAIYCGADGA